MLKGGWILVAGLLTGCGSFEGDMRMICDVETVAAADGPMPASADPAQIATIHAAYIQEHAKTDDGKAVLDALKKAASDPDETAKVLTDAQGRAGVQDCKSIAMFRAGAEFRTTLPN